MLDNGRPPPNTLVSDGMILTNGPPVQPIFSAVQPGFPHTFMSPHNPFPAPQMYIIATPEGSYLTYGLPPGVQMTRPNDPSSPPSVPIVTQDISAINPNVPSNDGHVSSTDNEAPEDIQEDDDVEENTEHQNTNNDCDNQNYKLSDELIESKVEGSKVSDNESKPVTDPEVTDSSDNAMPSADANSVNRSTSPSATATNTSANMSGGPKRAWADLFKPNSSTSNSYISSNHASSALTSGPIVSQSFINSLSESDSPLNSSVIVSESDRSAQIQSIPMRNDPFARKLAKRVKDMHLKHFLPFLIPYGLVNRATGVTSTL